MYCDERRDVVVRPPRFGEFADLDALITGDGLSDTTSDDLSAGRTGWFAYDHPRSATDLTTPAAAHAHQGEHA